MLTDVEGAILRLTMIKDLFDDLSVNSNCVSVLLNREDELALKTAIEALKEQRPHGEWKWKETCHDEHFRYGDIYCGRCGYVRHQVKPQMCINVALYRHHFCENCGADMRDKDELNRVRKELNSETQKSNSEIVPDYRDGWRLKEGEAE